MNTPRRSPILGLLSLCALLLVSAESRAQQTLPAAAYATGSSTTLPAGKQFASGAWGTANTTSTLGGDVAWQVLLNSPITSGRALLSLAQDFSLSIAFWSGSSWGSTTTLTTNAGAYATRPFAAAYEQSSGNLMAVYRKSSSTTLYYRTYTTATPAEQSFSMSLAAVPTWMQLVGKPYSNEMVLVVAAGSSLYAAVWNGTAWGNTTTLSAALPTSGQPFSVAYMTYSGKALVAWTATTGAPQYTIWNGTSWATTSSMPAIGGGVPAGWLTLASRPTSNEILFACTGTDKQINTNNWTGSGWGSNLVVETTAKDCYTPRFGLSYEADAATAVLAWHKSGQNALLYRTWSGGAWSAQQTGPDMGSESLSIRLAPGANSGEVMMLVRRRGAASLFDYTAYSQGSTVSTGSTNITGQVGQQVTGVTLPTPPAATAGSTSINLGSNATQTIAPGAYAALSAGSNSTLNFSAGTYVFTAITLSNSDTLNFDTSAGMISVIVTLGGVDMGNSVTFNNTGSAPVRLHIKAGDFTGNNSDTFNNIDVLVYNGDIDFNNGTSGTMSLYSSGSQTFKNNGTISFNPFGLQSSTALSSVLWTSGVPGAVTSVSATVVPSGVWEPTALAGKPMPARRITWWQETAPIP